MKTFSLAARFRALVLGFAVVGFGLWLRAADNAPAIAEPLAKALEGVWVQVGEPGNIKAAPTKGGTLKFRIGGHWTYTRIDPATGVARQHFGGTYQVRNGEYVEKIEYSSDDNDSELGSTLRFSVKIEGDMMVQTGIGNPYTEVWKRIR